VVIQQLGSGCGSIAWGEEAKDVLPFLIVNNTKRKICCANQFEDEEVKAMTSFRASSRPKEFI
jgi:hypothetical protein